jgi:DNA-binding transcriptional MerR regulator
MMKSKNEIDDAEDGERPIAGQLTYFNILAMSIQNINAAIMQEKDARDAAENLLSDLPSEWTDEIRDKIEEQEDRYNKIITESNKFLIRGSLESEKVAARKEIYLAGKRYSRNVKNIVISFLKQKDLLYQTKKKIEQGAINLYELQGIEAPDDD